MARMFVPDRTDCDDGASYAGDRRQARRLLGSNRVGIDIAQTSDSEPASPPAKAAPVATAVDRTTYRAPGILDTVNCARAQQVATGLRARRAVVNDVSMHAAAPLPHAGAARNDGASDREPHWFPDSAAKLHGIEQAVGVARVQ